MLGLPLTHWRGGGDFCPFQKRLLELRCLDQAYGLRVDLYAQNLMEIRQRAAFQFRWNVKCIEALSRLRKNPAAGDS